MMMKRIPLFVLGLLLATINPRVDSFLTQMSRIRTNISPTIIKAAPSVYLSIPAVPESTLPHSKTKPTFFIETHGCQMNLADSDVVRSVLLSAGYEVGNKLEDADLILINTCAIRENAEAKVWQRIKYFESIRTKNKKANKKRRQSLEANIELEGALRSSVSGSGSGLGPGLGPGPGTQLPRIGVLGCMAERLKTKLLRETAVDFIAGPDAYRDIPNLLLGTEVRASSSLPSLSKPDHNSSNSISSISSNLRGSDTTGDSQGRQRERGSAAAAARRKWGGQLLDIHQAANTQLSLQAEAEVGEAEAETGLVDAGEETYADIRPVRLAEGHTHAFVTITRGCDNHCAFCVVPYTRGRERSRPVDSILEEVRALVNSCDRDNNLRSGAFGDISRVEGGGSGRKEGWDQGGTSTSSPARVDSLPLQQRSDAEGKKFTLPLFVSTQQRVPDGGDIGGHLDSAESSGSLLLPDVKEIVLLGQNVNSYWDRTSPSMAARYGDPGLLELPVTAGTASGLVGAAYGPAPGFTERSARRRKLLLQQQQLLAGEQPSISAAAVGDILVSAAPGMGGEVDVSAAVGAVVDRGDRRGDRRVDGGGVRFAELLLRVAELNPEVRLRFQSPHPKDFPEEVLRVIASTPNICNSLHMPAQHGSSAVLTRMQRGYSREAYLGLVQRARDIIGAGTSRGVGLGLSSDFISGFCGETEQEHQELVSLVREVGYDQAFTYSYSLRAQTYAGLHLRDDVAPHIKARRLGEVIDAFQLSAAVRNNLLEVGRLHLVLVEGPAGEKRSSPSSSEEIFAEAAGSNRHIRRWTGRTDTNKRVIFEEVSSSHMLPYSQHSLYSLDNSRSAQHGGSSQRSVDTDYAAYPLTVLDGLSKLEAQELAALSLVLDDETTRLLLRSVAQAQQQALISNTPSTAPHGDLAISTSDSMEQLAKVQRHLTEYYSAAEARVQLKVQELLLRRQCSFGADSTGGSIGRESGSFGPCGGAIRKGSYVVVKITGGRGHTLRAAPVAVSSLQHAHTLQLPTLR